jgi:FAD/FMN-containing dehydrogenase
MATEDSVENSNTQSAEGEEMVVEEQKEAHNQILQSLKDVVGEERASDMYLERIVYSGDPSSLPQFHYRWKKKYLVDYVVRVHTTEEIQGILKVAAEHNIPVIPRGGASSCLGSSSPTRGGISVDTKQMNKILEINSDKKFVTVQAGVTFDALEVELLKKGLTFGIYPTSAKSAVIAGWIGCGGRAGIGTPHYGMLKENVLELKVVKPNGEIETLEGDGFDLICGSYGTLGIITEVKLKVHELPEGYVTFSYGFQRLEYLCQAVREISKYPFKPIFLKIADKEFQKYSNPLEMGNFILTVTYTSNDIIDNANQDSKFELEAATAGHGGEFLGEEFSEKEWELRYDGELKPKEYTETLMFQELWIEVDSIYDVLNKFESYRNSHKMPALWFGMLGTSTHMRLELYAMIDPDQYLKFIASKGILHKMVKHSIKLGSGPYTIGLQNSIYMSRAYPDLQEKMKLKKQEWDPNGIMNPDRITSCLTSYRRIDILFQLATKFRWLSKFIGA